MVGVVPPDEWFISRICEEFGCTPSEAMKQDALLVTDIMELRKYSAAKAAIEDPQSDEESLKGISDEMKDLVFGNIQRAIDEGKRG